MNHLAQIVFALTLHPSPSITGHVQYTVCMQFKRMAGFHSQFLSHTLSLSLSHTHASTLDARLSHATLYMYSVCMLFNALMYIII